MSDETPDTTGLREAVAQHLHERFAAEHEPHWRELDESEQADSIYTDMARSLFEPGAPLAVHPDPDASPDPTPEPDAGDVSLTDADDVALADWWVGEGGDYEDLALDSLTQVVERILASHVAAAREADRAEADALWEHVDSLRVQYAAKAANPSARFVRAADVVDDLPIRDHADRAEVEAMCNRAQRAEADRDEAEATLAGLVAKIEALADDIDLHDYTPECTGGGHPCQKCVAADAVRALIPADTATALDAVREQAKAEERERITQAIEAERPEMGMHINVTDYRRGMDDGLVKAARIARHTPEAT